MKDKICLITGATSGIGKVTALELAKKGASIVLLARNENKAENTRKEIIQACEHNTTNCLHPGVISSNFARNAGSGILYWFFKFTRPFLTSTRKGAETSIYLASDEEAGNYNGEFFVKKKPVKPSKEALNDKTASMLWSKSEKLTNIKFLDPAGV